MVRALVPCIVEFLSIKYEVTILIFSGKGLHLLCHFQLNTNANCEIEVLVWSPRKRKQLSL